MKLKKYFRYFLVISSLLLHFLYSQKIKSTPLFSLPINDAKYYLSWADSIKKGESFTSSAYFVEPGYAYLLSLFPDFKSLIFFQIILGSLIPVLIYYSCLKLSKNHLFSFLTSLLSVFLKTSLFYHLPFLYEKLFW